MIKPYLYVLLFSFAFIFVSCKKFVTNVDPPINEIEDSQLNNESQLPFLINGVEIQFAAAFSETDVCAADLSDAFFYDSNVPTETATEFENINLAKILLTNGLVGNDYEKVGQLRYYADDLIRRTNSITVHDTALKNRALFTGYFYGGFARYMYAAFFGLSQTEGGSPINNGPFIGSDNMYELAIDRFKESLKYTGDTLTTKTVNSVIARAYLYKGGFSSYDSASMFAIKGLSSGDPDFTTIDGNNFWWNYVSKDFLLEMVADNRFQKYIDADSNESKRIELDTVQVIKDSTVIIDTSAIGDTTAPEDTTVIEDTTIYYCQSAYSISSTPVKIITWQENNLMRAELNLRGFGSDGTSAKELVNEVRASHSIAPLNSVDLDTIYVERDKELFPSGNRLVDERRFNRWHLGSGTWEYLPIPQSERDGNPNIN